MPIRRAGPYRTQAVIRRGPGLRRLEAGRWRSCSGGRPGDGGLHVIEESLGTLAAGCRPAAQADSAPDGA
jgi:hypothetical protein